MIYTARKYGFVFCRLALGAVGALCAVGGVALAEDAPLQPANAASAASTVASTPASASVPVASTQPVARDLRLERDVAQRLQDEARFSLELRREPLAQMLALVENATAVRFRCGALPDAPISVTAQDAPLFSTLEPLFQEMGFAMRRDGLNVFLFSNRVPGADNAPDVPVAWSLWKGPGAPPVGWANPRPRAAQRVQSGSRLTGPVAADMVAQAASLRVEWNAPKSDSGSTGWSPAPLQVDAERRPGITVSTAPNEPAANAANAADAPVWMRWPLDLRIVPAGAQLSFETPCDVTLFVNGAPLVAGRHGSLLVNLDRVLRPGANCLALHWPRVPKNLQSPLLRYEWFVAGKPDVPPPAQAGARLENQNPQLSLPVLIQPEVGPHPGEAGAAFAER